MTTDQEKTKNNIVRVATKPNSNYLTAIAFKIKEDPTEIRLTAFGKNLEKAFLIAKQAQEIYPVKIKTANPLVQRDAAGTNHSGIEIILMVTTAVVLATVELASTIPSI